MSVLASFNRRKRVIVNPLIFDISINPGENSQHMKSYDWIIYDYSGWLYCTKCSIFVFSIKFSNVSF